MHNKRSLSRIRDCLMKAASEVMAAEDNGISLCMKNAGQAWWAHGQRCLIAEAPVPGHDASNRWGSEKTCRTSAVREAEAFTRRGPISRRSRPPTQAQGQPAGVSDLDAIKLPGAWPTAWSPADNFDPMPTGCLRPRDAERRANESTDAVSLGTERNSSKARKQVPNSERHYP